MLIGIVRRILWLLYRGLELTATLTLGAIMLAGTALIGLVGPFLPFLFAWAVLVLIVLLLQFVAKFFVELLLTGIGSLLLAALIRGLLLRLPRPAARAARRRARVPEFEILESCLGITEKAELAGSEEPAVPGPPWIETAASSSPER